MEARLRLTGEQHRALKEHLFPGDGREAVAVLLCGRHRSSDGEHVFIVRETHPIPHSECAEREHGLVRWPTDRVEPLLRKASANGMALVKAHGHPEGCGWFSPTDDRSDRELFRSVFGWTDANDPHASVVMQPDGSMFGHTVGPTLEMKRLRSFAVAGDDLLFSFNDDETEGESAPEFMARHLQLFGEATSRSLRSLCFAVVGCSGLGGPVVEMLARLGARRLVLVDPEAVELVNLNRIPNATVEDARLGTPKVMCLAAAVERMGLGTEVIPLQANLATREAVLAVAGVDVVFGCMDGVEGRHLLGRLTSYYSLPYFDLGVRLRSDGEGGVRNVSGAVHYMKPGGSSLLSRGVYTMAQVEAEALRRTNPKLYAERRAEGYIEGVEEARPSVVSMNFEMAALGVNEFLARVHPFRERPNWESELVYRDLVTNWERREFGGEPCAVFAPLVGLGDSEPLLGLPAL